MRRSLAVLVLLLACASFATAQAPPKVTTAHAISMYGDVKYPLGFKHLDYANPAAPKGGTVRLGTVGTFDSLNGFVLKGVPAAGLGQLHETLTVSSLDEPLTEYGLLAESIEVPADRSWVAFTLRPEARFNDGSPVTVDDVIWTFEALKEKGHPRFKSYWAQVTKAEKAGDRKVKFLFAPGENRELPLITGQLPVLPKAYWAKRDFEKTTLEPPLGSGAYRIESVDPGRSIVYRRVPNYWGAKLGIKVGRDNFEVIRYEYFRDPTVALEAFKGGQFDFRQENSAKNWATAYAIPAVSQGLIQKEELPHQIPTGMQSYVFNTRRAVFQDARVRRAIGYLFDFEWTNKNLFYGSYARTRSYFSNSELASSGLPGPDELRVLEPVRGKIPDEAFTKEYQPPVTDGSGNVRENAREALRLLGEAGWTIKGQKLVNARSEPMTFEILLSDPLFERITLPFVKNLERVGITAHLRTIDTAQYQRRLETFDFDVTVDLLGQSLSPGNEQREYWTTHAAGVPGSHNLAGIRDPVVDRLVDLVVQAPDRKELVARTRALDRVLLWGFYGIPHFHLRAFRLAYWDKFARPAVAPKYGLALDTWWVDAKKDAALAKHRGELGK
ncbi:MAG: ABC transporter substrate-binding protein [Candidatus Rokubacteria bacterium]|nr:ABC transporter substrate-binding protein [Candidatus Rokubacteria bacterium]